MQTTPKQNETAEKLRSLGWKCSLCNCPAQKRYDCFHSSFRNTMIKVRGSVTEIYKSGLRISQERFINLDDQLKKYELLK